MKKLFLIDLNCTVIHSIINSPLIEVHTIIVGTNKYKEELSKKYNIQNMFSIENIQNFYKEHDYILDYKLLLKYKHTQVKIENWFQRFSSDVNMIQYLYATSLSFWHQYFMDNKIDTVLSCTQEWGSNFDSLIFDIAVEYDKKIYIIENTLVDGNKVKYQSIFDYKSKKYIKFNTLKKENSIDLSSFLHYTQTDKIFHGNSSLKEVLKQTPDKYGGYLLVMFFSLIIGKYKSNMFSFDISWWTYFKNYIHIKRMHRYYKSLSIDLDPSNKFIFFALHMEPEANTLARTVFSNQLVIIKAISTLLPKGWKLYVKDHPRQYVAFNNFKRYYFLVALEKYRTKMFYDELIKIPNVELIDLKVNSKKIIEQCEAVVTINGSIILETIVQNKPLLLFSQNSTPFINFEGIFNIKNSDDLREAILKINSKYSPEYNSLNLFINEYVFKVSSDIVYDYGIILEDLV